MRSLPGLRGPRAASPELLLLLYLLASAHRSSADGLPAASPFTNLPVREEMLARYSNLSLESHNISLTEHSNVSVEKNITLQRPSSIELTCQFTVSGDPGSVNVTWEKDGELLDNDYSVSATGGVLYTQYTSEALTCKTSLWQDFTLDSWNEGGREAAGEGTGFDILLRGRTKSPEIHGKNKPLITYMGDSTVLVCKCQGCFPLSWTWYSSNGSVQVPLDAQMDNKHVVNGTSVNETRLRIMSLSEDDQGTYWCRAVFPLGDSEGHVELVVLSYLVPLKPFLAIAAEVIVLVAIILLCEMYTQKKKNRPDDGKEFEQIEQLKPDDSNGIENNAPRLRKNESVTSD